MNIEEDIQYQNTKVMHSLSRFFIDFRLEIINNAMLQRIDMFNVA